MPQNSLLLPKAIRTAREKCGWTQAELAEKMGVTQSTISFWERGIETPALENQVRLATLIPDIFDLLAEQEADLISRLYQLERVISKDQCTCEQKGIASNHANGSAAYHDNHNETHQEGL